MSRKSRRSFLSTAMGAGALAVSCGKAQPKVEVPEFLDVAPDGPVLKAGVIGCGGRNSGAALQFLNAGPNLQITAIGDTFQDRVDSMRENLLERADLTLPDSNCFVGFDSYQKVIDSDVDVVLIATPPQFRPRQFASAVAAGKHVFMEKPLAVDPVGIRSILESAGQAKTKGLVVVTGTQRRHQREYVETYRRVAEGAIGDIVATRSYWNQNQLWFREHQPGWTDMEWMVRDWVNWTWLSGDHIVEQHVHNLDVINWFTGMYPTKAVGFGSRHRRVTGDQYDNFAIDFEFENGMHNLSMCRQINGCAGNVSEYIVGTRGSTNCADTIFNPDGSVEWMYDGPKVDPYQQEHIDLVNYIRTSEPFNEAENTAKSTLCAIMGRISAYTGLETTWQEMMDSDLKIGPDEYVMGDMDMTANIPVPGSERQRRG